MQIRMMAAALVSACCVVGCRTTTEPLPAGLGYLTTDASSYVALPAGQVYSTTIYELTVVTTFHNPTESPVDFGRCNPSSTGTTFNVIRVSPGAAAAYEPMWACVGGVPPIVVAPHAMWVDTVNLRGPNAFDGHTHAPYGLPAGVFRLEYFPVCEVACTLPDSSGFSNAFDVTLGS